MILLKKVKDYEQSKPILFFWISFSESWDYLAQPGYFYHLYYYYPQLMSSANKAKKSYF